MQLVLLLGLGAIMTAFVAYGMSLMQHSQSTGFLGWLVSKAERIPIFGTFTTEQILKLDGWILHYVGQHFKAVEGRAIAWLAGLKQYVGYMASAAVAPAVAGYIFAQWLISVGLPNAINARTADIRSNAAQAKTYAKYALRLSTGLEKAGPALPAVKEVPVIQRVAMPHAQEWSWLHDHWTQVKSAVLNAAVLPVAHVLPRVEPITWPYGLTPTRLRKRLWRLEHAVAPLAIAAALSLALGVSKSCLRPGGNISRIAKRFCGLGPTALEDLLGLLADVLILQNICTVITVVEDGFKLIEPELTAFITTAEKQFVHCKYDLPTIPAIDLPYLPPVTGVVLNQAA